MNAYRVLRTMTGLAAAALLGLAVPVMPTVAEMQLPEEALLERMRAGDVEAARDGFEALVRNHIEQINAVPADHPKATEARIIRATQLISAMHLWQLAEIEQRLAGSQPPNDLNVRMLATAEALIESAATVNQVRIQLNADSDVPEWLDRDSKQVSEQLGQAMLETAAFLRDANFEDERLRLMQEAGKYTTVPATLRELDLQQGNLRQTFQISTAISEAPADNADTVVAEVRDPLRDAAVRALLEDYYTKLFSGDIVGLQTQFAAGYWPAQELNYVAAKLSGCVLESLGDVRTRPVATDEYYVEIKNLNCIDPSGSQLTMADHLLLKREGGSFRILLLDARDR